MNGEVNGGGQERAIYISVSHCTEINAKTNWLQHEITHFLQPLALGKMDRIKS